jgi:tRNA uridine 5-carbamoylmethylation protein Kti12
MRHKILDPILKSEMGYQPVLDSVMRDEFDIIFGQSAYYGQDSRPVASKVLQYLLDKRMVILDESNTYRWMYMFLRCEDLETYQTLPSGYVACPNFHARGSQAP